MTMVFGGLGAGQTVEIMFNSSFVLPESKLDTIKYDPPSLTNHEIHRNSQPEQYDTRNLRRKRVAPTVDIVSLGSKTRPSYMHAQIDTWTKHESVRYYWGFNEVTDFETMCSNMGQDDLRRHVKRCTSRHSLDFDSRIMRVIQTYYGFSEGQQRKREDAGWVCAQRRLGRAFGWIYSRYEKYSQRSKEMNLSVDNRTGTSILGHEELPDYLIFVDDDTFLDMNQLVFSLGNEELSSVSAACYFRLGQFSTGYGGFGIFLNKKAQQNMLMPIYCDGGELSGMDRIFTKSVCKSLQRNRIYELQVFREGMNLMELFYKYSAIQDFCLHSDWVLGYIYEFYLKGDDGKNFNGLRNLNNGTCGNFTDLSGKEVRQCSDNDVACHRQMPNDMELLARSSYARSPESYIALPVLSTANATYKQNPILEKRSQNTTILINDPLWLSIAISCVLNTVFGIVLVWTMLKKKFRNNALSSHQMDKLIISR